MKALFIALLGTALTFSAYAETEPEMNPAETYAMFCGSQKELIAFAKSQGQKVTKKDLVELNEQRKPMINILLNGNKAIQQLLDEGSKSDTGSFGAIMTCGMLVQMKAEVLKKGCFDLLTNKATMNVSGIEACEALMDRLPK